MALSDLQVFEEWTYKTMTEVIDQQIDKFNGASRGCISLSPSAHTGDYSDAAFFKRISGLVRRRDAYGSGAVSGKTMVQIVDTMVKVAAGTPPVSLDPGQFKWIRMNPETAGAAMGQQLAGDMMADMLNTAIAAGYAAMSQITALVQDGTAGTITPSQLNSGAAKFGDRSMSIVAWIAHSKVMHDYYGSNITNSSNLFTYGTVNVMADPFGKIFVVLDSPGLVTSGTPDTYHTMGLVPGAITVNQNNDFHDNYSETNGNENIQMTYQAEWSFQLGIKGFAWDKTNGGKSPNDAALVTATNWDQYATSNKDTAGVIVNTQ